MPAFILVRLYRMLPLVVVLALIAVAVYFFVSWRHTPTHAKHALIKVFTMLGIGLTGFFAAATIYAILDGNAFVAELFLIFAVFMAILLGITLLCRRAFLKKHPNFKWKLTPRTKASTDSK